MAPIIALSAVDASFLNSTCCAQPMFSSSGLQLGYFVCSPLLDSAKTASLCHDQCRVRSGSCKVSKPQSRQRVQTGFGQHHLSTETSPKPGVLPCYCANSAVWQWSKNRRSKECATVACVAGDRQVLVTQFTVARFVLPAKRKTNRCFVIFSCCILLSNNVTTLKQSRREMLQHGYILFTMLRLDSGNFLAFHLLCFAHIVMPLLAVVLFFMNQKRDVDMSVFCPAFSAAVYGGAEVSCRMLPFA